ncbi:MAG TPA: electron transfer flavoprotein subunit alpha/FixB family protein [Thermoanaerobaculia bacterium]|nr:electron transfer flavoprotein subunit alpha/FixB family protein [Thermoanaerobaculia bacterium]
MADVLVVCESKDGKLKKSSKEALSIGAKLAASLSGKLVAFSAGGGAGELAAETGKYGAAKLVAMTEASLDRYSTEAACAAVKAVVDEVKPAVLLFSATSNGRDLAPRVGARLGVGVASDVTALEISGGKLRARRPNYSGRVVVTVEIDGAPAIATCRPNAFPIEERGGAASEVSEMAAPSTQPRAVLIETKMPEAGELSIAEADIIVSGGRGLKEAANFSYIRDLAHAINGAVGASRATVDAGWIDHQHQVGQTGRVVSPNLYIAAGISGAIQHLAGMSSSKHIVAINKDAESPIFRIADLGVVGDLFTILPALTEEVKKAKEHH